MKRTQLTVSILTIALLASLAVANENRTTQRTRTGSTSRSAVTQVVSSQSAPTMTGANVTMTRPVSRSVTKKKIKSNVLVVPAGEVDTAQIAATVEDMQVMSHIIETNIESAAVAPAAAPMLGDMGALFMTREVGSEAIYIEDCGALFMMTVEFPLAATPAAADDTADTNEPADKTWQQARAQVLSPGAAPKTVDPYAVKRYDAERVEQLKKNLIAALKHASNMRNVASDESVIIILRTSRGHFSTLQTLMMMTNSENAYGGMAMGGYGGGASSGYGPGNRYDILADPDSGPDEQSAPSTMTIRVKKSDIDDFAKGNLNLEQFTTRVKIITY